MQAYKVRRGKKLTHVYKYMLLYPEMANKNFIM